MQDLSLVIHAIFGTKTKLTIDDDDDFDRCDMWNGGLVKTTLAVTAHRFQWHIKLIEVKPHYVKCHNDDGFLEWA